VATLAAASLAPGVALAEVRYEGDWSGDDPEVSLDLVNVPRMEAMKRLAAEAGWSVVIGGALPSPPGGAGLTLHVRDQPAGKLLDLLLADGHYVARRSDNLISISPDDGSAPAVLPVPPVLPLVPPVPLVSPVPPVPGMRAQAGGQGYDRMITGGNLRIEADEVVHDVTLMGGNLEVYGTITGDLSVVGGNAHLHRDAHVQGDAATLGGNLIIDSGASVDGDVGVVGGSLHREDGAYIGGEIHEGMHRASRHHHYHRQRHVARSIAGGTATSPTPPAPREPAKAKTWMRETLDAINVAALLFVFGAVVLALLPERMEKLKVQIASHPMRSFATGIVSLLAGIVLGAAVFVTVIGIPLVVAAILAAGIGTLAGMCSVLETVGCALLGHRTKNPYVHLAFGGLIFLVLGAIPVVGGLVWLAVVFTALGSFVATRAAGFFPARSRGGSPYRTAAVVDA
jgi:hypothetical protein